MSPQDLINRFLDHLIRMQFEKAREFAELEKIRTDWVDFSSLDENFWPALMTVLAQLANLESLFFSLSYLLNKFPFRKENNIRDIYVQLRSEFLRISTGVEHSQAETATKTSAVSACASKFAHFVSIRINLVEFYTSLPVKEWRAFDEYLQPLIGSENACPSLVNVQKQPELYMCCTNELNALKLLHRAQLAIQKCDALDALLMLKRSRDLLDDWFCSLDACPTSKPSAGASFFLAFSSRRRSSISRLGFLQFLLHFHQTMVAKFTLYFYDTFIHFSPHNEMKQAFSAPNSFLQICHTFARKSNAHTVCLLLNRIDQDTPFQGFGYHFGDEPSPPPPAPEIQQNVINGANNQGQKQQPNGNHQGILDHTKAKDLHAGQTGGLSEKYPALLLIPSERRHDHSHYATICSFVQEGCGSGGSAANNGNGNAGGSSAISTSTANLASETGVCGGGKIRYLYDKNKEQTFFTACIEKNIHLVVTFERRVQEREGSLHAFFGEMLGNLRCTKLFQEIKNMGK